MEGGYNDKSSTFAGLSEAEVLEAMTLPRDEMPDYAGTDEERDALVRHLLDRAKQGGAK